ncbi:MAG: glycosyltransferase family 4 protein [Pseudomonadota bacterium]
MQDEPIGFLIPEFPGQTHIAWWRVAQELKKLGHPVQLLSTRRPDSASGVHPLLERDVETVLFAWPPGFGHVLGEVIRNPLGAWRAGRYLASLTQSSVRQKLALLPILLSSLYLASELRRRGIKHVFVHSCANAAHLLAMCNRISGVRYALRLGGDPDVYGRDHHHKMQRAEFVLSASPSYFDELIDKHGVDPGKLHWSWVGTDLSFYRTDPAWPHNRDGNRLRIATVARLNLAKGHLYALEAVRALVSLSRRVDYTLIGDGPYRGEIESFIAEHGLGNHVHLLGSKDAAEIARILQATDITILASVGAGEAAPAVVCESMAAGVPVLATQIGATEHMIKNGVDGFIVKQRDSDAILEHLLCLTEDADRLAQMKLAAKASAAQFDVRLTAEKILSLFQEAQAQQML